MKISVLSSLVSLSLVSCQEKIKQESSPPSESTKISRPVTPASPADPSSPTKNPRPLATDAPAELTDAEMKGYEGLTLEEAEKRADAQNRKHRVVERDGKPLPTTRDLRPDRLNFKVQDGKVIGVTKG